MLAAQLWQGVYPQRPAATAPGYERRRLVSATIRGRARPMIKMLVQYILSNLAGYHSMRSRPCRGVLTRSCGRTTRQSLTCASDSKSRATERLSLAEAT